MTPKSTVLRTSSSSRCCTRARSSAFSMSCECCRRSTACARPRRADRYTVTATNASVIGSSTIDAKSLTTSGPGVIARETQMSATARLVPPITERIEKERASQMTGKTIISPEPSCGSAARTAPIARMFAIGRITRQWREIVSHGTVAATPVSTNTRPSAANSVGSVSASGANTMIATATRSTAAEISICDESMAEAAPRERVDVLRSPRTMGIRLSACHSRADYPDVGWWDPLVRC
jgi:hypothetical protein